MKPEWKEFLINAGAELDEGRVLSFGNPEREKRMTTTGGILCDLSHFGLIAAYGEDAETFLQGQLSNDLRQVDTEHSRLSAYCSPKGRMLAVMRLFRRSDTYYLRMPRELIEATLKRLHMFVLMSKVTLEDADDALVRFGFSGPQAAEELGEALGEVPEAPDALCFVKDYSVIRVPGPHPRFEIYGELEPMKKLWDTLNVRAAPVGASAWALLDILAGIPNVFKNTVEAFVPQMANMQLVDGVSFKKGCYPGQEIVARMQYLGKLKRRMYRLNVKGEAEPGTEVYAEDDSPGQASGKIVDAQAHPDGGTEVLAVLQIDKAESKPLHLASLDGPPMQMRELPYAFEAKKD